MTVSRILSSAATIHSARAYVKPGQTVSAMFNAHNERRASVGLALSALLADDRSMYLPRFDAGPYSDRYRHELQFIGLVFQDDLTAEWLYRNVQAEDRQHAASSVGHGTRYVCNEAATKYFRELRLLRFFRVRK